MKLEVLQLGQLERNLMPKTYTTHQLTMAESTVYYLNVYT